MNERNERKNWIDYFKGIAIILVVVGHATGKFNGYIYQFHVAAFFWISGYLSSIEKKTFDELFIIRFLRLILPYTFYGLCGITLFWLFQKCGILNIVSSFESIPPLRQNIRTLYNGLYCDWLGATWFLVSLFIATCMCKLALLMDHNKGGILFLLIILFVYNMGYFYIQNSVNPVFFSGLGHYCVVQFFFALGFLCRRYGDKNILNIKMKHTKIYFWVLCAVNILLFKYFKQQNWSMDLVSSRVNAPLIDCVIALNGICFIYIISKLLEILKCKYLNQLMSYIGKNTFGILIYHFFGFKLATLCLSLFGVCDWKMVSLLCPAEDISNIWWWLYVIIAISFSLLIWSVTTKLNIIKFLSGVCSESYMKIYKKYEEIVNER